MAGLLLVQGAEAYKEAPSRNGTSPAFDSRIVNGVVTSDWPSVGFLFPSGCTATFIGCRTALTAAHCVCNPGEPGPACPDDGNLIDPSSASVFLPNYGSVVTKSIRVKPDFEFTQQGDLAVLEFENPVRGIRPSPINDVAKPSFGTAGTIVGFGVTSSTSDDSGVKRVGAVTTGSCAGATAPDATHICWNFNAPLGPPGTHSSTCFGDSGGPLFVDVGAGLTIAGVASGATFTSDPCIDVVAYEADVYLDRVWVRQEDFADQAVPTCGAGPQVGDPQVTTANLGGFLSGQASHTVFVPVPTKLLIVTLNAEFGSSPGNDFDLYVRFGAPPTTSVYDCAPLVGGSFEQCIFADPFSGTWHILIDTFSGMPANYQVTSTSFPEDPAPPALVAGDVVVADFEAWELVRIDGSTGERANVSSRRRGTGRGPVYPMAAILDTDDSIVATNGTPSALLRIDPASGNRTVISGCADEDCSSTVGAGPAFLGPRGVALEDTGQFVVTDRSDPANAVVRVDPAAGNRTLLSGCVDVGCTSQVGTGQPFTELFGITVEDATHLLVADTVAVLRIDLANGNRSVVSGCTNPPTCSASIGSGPSFSNPTGLTLEADGDILVTDAAEGATFSAIFLVDPLTGARTIVSGCSNAGCSEVIGTGPNFEDGLSGIALDAAGDLVVSDAGLHAVIRVDAANGNRAVLSGCVDATCNSVVGGGPLLTEPAGLIVLPEPRGALSWAAGLGMLALLSHRRKSR